VPGAKGGTLKTIVAALDVLEYLAAKGRPVRLTDISRDLGIHKGKTHRILSTLQSRGYVQQHPYTRQYFLGFSMWLQGQRVIIGLSLLNVARPLLEQWETQETVFLALLDGIQTLYIYEREGLHPVRANVPIGSRGPLHASATGKALLAYQRREFIDAYIREPLTHYTANTIIDPEALVSELNEIRQKGYAMAIDEWYEGLSGIAAPISGKTGQVFAAVGMSVPTSRFTSDRIQAMAQSANEIASEISLRVNQNPSVEGNWEVSK